MCLYSAVVRSESAPRQSDQESKHDHMNLVVAGLDYRKTEGSPAANTETVFVASASGDPERSLCRETGLNEGRDGPCTVGSVPAPWFLMAVSQAGAQGRFATVGIDVATSRALSSKASRCRRQKSRALRNALTPAMNELRPPFR